MIQVFVYGTLMVGERNHHVAAPYLQAVQPGRVRGHLYNVGNYPALVLDEAGDEIEGEWFTLTAAALKALDQLEEYYGPGQANHYERVRVQDETNGMSGWVYVWEDSRGCPSIPSGSWRLHQQG